MPNQTVYWNQAEDEWIRNKMAEWDCTTSGVLRRLIHKEMEVQRLLEGVEK